MSKRRNGRLSHKLILFLFSLLIIFVLFQSDIIERRFVLDNQTFLNLPNDFVWNGLYLKRLVSPLPLPNKIINLIPWAKEFKNYYLFFSAKSNNFILVFPLPSKLSSDWFEQEFCHLFALHQPEKRKMVLPDKSEWTELVYNPNRLIVKRLPSFNIHFIKEGEPEMAWAILNNHLFFSNSTPLLLRFIMSLYGF
jgi:hypothetical protein